MVAKSTIMCMSDLLNQYSVPQGRVDEHGAMKQRDFTSIFKYKEKVSQEDFITKFKRQSLAYRIVTAYPDAIWAKPPMIVDNDGKNAERETPFEKAVDILIRRKRIWEYLRRADILCGLGEYSILYIGLPGGIGNQYVAPPGIDYNRIAYLAPFSQKSATIAKFDGNPANKTFGQPLQYQITIDGEGYQSDGESEIEEKLNIVHASRAIHMAEGKLEGEVRGKPRLEAVFNDLDNVEKILGAAAEIFWLNSRGALALEAEADAATVDMTQQATAVNDMLNQLGRVIGLQGVKAHPIEFKIASPKEHYDILIANISGGVKIPSRILSGAERGELASSQDENNWWGRVDDRRKTFNEQEMIRPFIDRLIEFRILPTPRGGDYDIIWPDLTTVNAEQKADYAVKFANALSQYVNADGANLVVPPEQFVRDILGLIGEVDPAAAAMMTKRFKENMKPKPTSDKPPVKDGG